MPINEIDQNVAFNQIVRLIYWMMADRKLCRKMHNFVKRNSNKLGIIPKYGIDNEYQD